MKRHWSESLVRIGACRDDSRRTPPSAPSSTPLGAPWDDDGRCNACGEQWKDREYVTHTPDRCPNADCPSRDEPALTPAEMDEIERQESAPRDPSASGEPGGGTT